MNIDKKKIILSTEIEYNYDYKEKGYSLLPCEHSKNTENTVNSREIEKITQEIITDKLPDEMKKIFGIEIETNIISTDYGSIIFFFGVIIAGVNLLANYKNLYDSIELIKKQTTRLIKNKLSSKYGKRFDVNTEIEYSPYSKPLPDRFFKMFRKQGKSLDFLMEEFPEFFYLFYPTKYINKNRDGFFYFLLSATIILAIMLGILVYSAVIKTYFL